MNEKRFKILAEFGKNIIFDASAGTGKTSLLASKILVYILGEALKNASAAEKEEDKFRKMESFIAMTFTEKAAGELRERIRTLLMYLADRSGKIPDDRGHISAILDIKGTLTGFYKLKDDEIIRRAAAASERCERFSISTIHGFLGDILRQSGTWTGLPPEFTVDESGVLKKNIFDQMWQKKLTAELSDDSDAKKLWKILLDFAADIGSMQDLIFSLAGSTITEEEFDNLKKDLSVPVTAEPVSDEKKKSKIIFHVNTELFDAFLSLHLPFIPELRKEWKKKGIVGFEHMLLFADELLNRFETARRKISEKYRVFFVDETQDTDPLQYAIIGKIITDKKGKTGQGRLFIVGDPKQSIYAFRGADLRAYQAMKEKIRKEGGKSFSLTENYRSRPEIISHVNEVFQPMFDGICDYDPLNAFRDSLKIPEHGILPHVEIWIAASETEKGICGVRADQAREIEAYEIAKWISENVSRLDLHRNEDSAPDILRYSDIAILIPALTKVDFYLEQLRRFNIPFVVEGDKRFYYQEEVLCILNLLKAVINPEDTVALAGFLRSPLGGVPDTGLLELKNTGALEDERIGVEGNEDWKERFRRALKNIVEIRRELLHKPVSEVSKSILEKFPVIQVFAAMPYGAQKVVNILKVLGDFKNSYQSDMENIYQWVSRKSADVESAFEEPESRLWEEKMDVVRIMSIHKAKGLEFPVVFLPDNGRKPKTFSEHKGFGYKYSFSDRMPYLYFKEDGRNIFVTPSFEKLKENMKQNEEGERVRLMYVAHTRAREKLIVLGGFMEKGFRGTATEMILSCKGRIRENEQNKPEPVLGSGVKFIYGETGEVRIADEVCPVQAEKIPQDVLSDEKYAGFWKEAKNIFEKGMEFVPVRSPTSMGKDDFHKRDDQDEAAESFEKRGIETSATLTGTICHEVMGKIDFTDPLDKLDEYIEKFALQKMAHDEIIKDVREILENFFKTRIFSEIQKSEIIGREIPFIMKEEGNSAIMGFIDLVYRKEGRIIIADYKTGRFHRNDLPAYEAQKIYYSKAIHQSLSLPYMPEFHFIFMRDGEVI
jgi:ATP-dependent helicase/nuclease subunit A